MHLSQLLTNGPIGYWNKCNLMAAQYGGCSKNKKRQRRRKPLRYRRQSGRGRIQRGGIIAPIVSTLAAPLLIGLLKNLL